MKDYRYLQNQETMEKEPKYLVHSVHDTEVIQTESHSYEDAMSLIEYLSAKPSYKEGGIIKLEYTYKQEKS